MTWVLFVGVAIEGCCGGCEVAMGGEVWLGVGFWCMRGLRSLWEVGCFWRGAVWGCALWLFVVDVGFGGGGVVVALE